MTIVLRFWLPVSLFIIQIMSPSTSMAQTDFFDKEFPDAASVLLTQEPGDLNERARCDAAEAWLDVERPAMAQWILGEVTENESAIRQYLRFRIASMLGLEGIASTHIEKALEKLTAGKSKLGEKWDMRLSEVSAILRENGDIETGNNFIERWSRLSPSSSKLAIELLAWRFSFESFSPSPSELFAVVSDCATCGDCANRARLLAELDRPLFARRLLLKAMKKAANEKDHRMVFDSAIRIGEEEFARRAALSWIHMEPSLETIEHILDELSQAGSTLVETVEGYEPTDDAGLWKKIRLLWIMGRQEQARELIPDAKRQAKNIDGTSQELKTWIRLIRETRSPDERIQWTERVRLAFDNGMKLSPDSALRLRWMLAISGIALMRSDPMLLSQVARMIESDTVMSKLMEFRILQEAGEAGQAATRAQLFLEHEPGPKELLWEIAVFMDKQKLFDRDQRAREGIIGSIEVGEDEKHSAIRQMIGARALSSLGKKSQAIRLLSEQAEDKLISSEKLSIISNILDNHGYRAARRLIEDFPEDIDGNDRFRALLQFFRANRHESALAIFHEIELEYGDKGAMDLARRTAFTYKRYREELTRPRRHGRASIELFVHLCIRSLKRHIKHAEAGADWPEVFGVLKSIDGDPRIGDMQVNRKLREALWETEEDLESTRFDFFRQFESFGPQPLDRWIALGYTLAKERNLDYYEIAKTHLNLAELEASCRFNLVVMLMSGKEFSDGNSLERNLDYWRESLPRAGRAEAYLEMGRYVYARYVLGLAEHEKLNRATESYRHYNKQLLRHLEKMEESFAIDAKGDPPKPLKISVTVSPDPETHDYGAEEIAEQLRNLEWLIADCMIEEDIEEELDFELSLVTDKKGYVRQAKHRNLSGAFSKAGKNLRNRFRALRLDEIDEPFGYGNVRVKIKPKEARGWTSAEISVRRQRIAELKSGLMTGMEQADKELERSSLTGKEYQSQAGGLFKMAYSLSYDPEIYRTVAWWMYVISGEATQAERILNEAKWIGLVSPMGISILVGLSLAVFLLLRRRKNKSMR